MRRFSVRLSAEGKLVVPEEVRVRYGWTEGTEILLEAQEDTVVLRALRLFPETTLEELVGCAGYKGPTRSLEEMEVGIAVGARERR
ncbi:MAG TPA: AbrB/MazE/SpoVT family DNA-binding domain-containing protein [Thermoanaerobaculia bacterium]|nr:AbrB/MazE/SpoVT family DNA-binding domain-containing protein [Thermoanaerobaculia bacterium]